MRGMNSARPDPDSMVEKEARLFPVLVEGDWGPSVSKSMQNKFLRYIQSPKRWGEGCACQIHVELDKENQIGVYFAQENVSAIVGVDPLAGTQPNFTWAPIHFVRQRVLGLKTHELEMWGRKKLKLSVSLPPEAEVTDKDVFERTTFSSDTEDPKSIQMAGLPDKKKQEMDAKNGKNEKLLFHGTTSKTIGLINTSEFNRSYAGMHAAVYGNGTYFAVSARYSADDSYSKPDACGKKYMYLARVLVGEYCVGKTGLVVPKAKNKSDPTDLFDSVTDNVRTPSMFVIFNDIQAYPEYLITFKK